MTRYVEFEDTVFYPAVPGGSQLVEATLTYKGQSMPCTLRYSSANDAVTIQTRDGDRVEVSVPRFQVHCALDAIGFLNKTRPDYQGTSAERKMFHLVGLMGAWSDQVNIS